MRLSVLGIILLSACGSSIGVENKTNKAEDCLFEQSAAPTCNFRVGKDVFQVVITTSPMGDDEVVLTSATVTLNGKSETLTLSPDISMIKGDTGIVSLPDINFDGHADLAISTSFAVANQYFDYWVFDTKTGKYRKIGSYPKFSIDVSAKSLGTTVKMNAAQYEKKSYYWQGDKLLVK